MALSVVAAGVLFAQGGATEMQHEDKHIFGIIPNYKTIPTTSDYLAPLSVRQKFHLAAQDSFDPSTLLLAGLWAGIAQLQDDYASWGLGAEGYGKRYVAAYVDQAVGNFMSEAIMPSLFHQDPRFYRLGRGGFWHRTRYAVGRTVLIRSDSGKDQFNFSEILGNSAAVAISNAYYPAESRNASSAAAKLGLQLGTDAFFNVMKEFWPDIKHNVLRQE